MTVLSPLPVWLDRRFTIIEESGHTVGDILAALAAGEHEARAVLLRRRAGPELLPPDLSPDGFAILLETSGTTGPAKRVLHRLDRLRGRLRGTGDADARWLLTYDPASYAGLQVILTAAQAGATLVAAPGADVAALAAHAVRHAVTHISGTPSFWRGFLLASPKPLPDLAAVTLGGEAVDQRLLDELRARFPRARLRHIYASTEAGTLFAVTDGRAGFPAAWLETGIDGVRLAVEDGTLRVASPRAMLGFADGGTVADGWLDTGDLVEVDGDRAWFRGRRDGRVNVGGVKVSPEAVEAVILAVDGVADAWVTALPSPIVGEIITATIVPAPNADPERLRTALREATAVLPPAARPRVLTFADAVPLSASGKKARGAA